MNHKGDKTAARQRRRHRVRARLEASRPVFLERPCVTIFADASLHHDTQTGGWGVWIKGDGRAAIIKSGPFVGQLLSSTEAEVRALANGLAIARAAGLTPQGACVMLQSDCSSALSWILSMVETSCSRPTKGGLPISQPSRISPVMASSAGLKSIATCAKANGLKIVLRHVRGHAKADGSRQSVNRLTDKLAGKAAKGARPKKTKGPPVSRRPPSV